MRKTVPKEVPFKAYIYCTKAANKRNTLWKNKNYLYVDDRDHNAFDYPLNGKVIGEFVCDNVVNISVTVRNLNETYNYANVNNECAGTCLTWKQLGEYGKGKPLYALHITALKVYDKPRELGEFCTPCKNLSRGACNSNNCDYSKFKLDGKYTYIICRNIITRPPQSYMYIKTPDWAEEK